MGRTTRAAQFRSRASSATGSSSSAGKKATTSNTSSSLTRATEAPTSSRRSERSRSLPTTWSGSSRDPRLCNWQRLCSAYRQLSFFGGGYGRIDAARAGPSEGQEAHGRDREDDRTRRENSRTALHQAGGRAHDPREDRGADLLSRGEGARHVEAARGARYRVVRGAPLRGHRESGDREHAVRLRRVGREVQGDDGEHRAPRFRGRRGQDVPEGPPGFQKGRA